jgi:hypothetical protein
VNPIKERFRLQIFSPGLSSMYFQIVVASPIFAILVFFLPARACPFLTHSSAVLFHNNPPQR